MDFKRIQRIFFWAFLCLNIFLLYTFYQGRIDQVPTSELSKVADIENRLKIDKISFEGSFSEKVREGYYLSAETTNFHDVLQDSYDKIENQRLSRTLPITNQKSVKVAEVEKELKQLLRTDQPILFGPEYSMKDLFVEEKEEVILAQFFEGLPFNDETSELVFDVQRTGDDLVTLNHYSQTHLAEIQPLREKQEVISEKEAIKTLYMSNKIANESKITKTELAYTRLFTVRDKNVYIPAWFVWIESSKQNIQIERVNAFTNSIISTSIPEVKK